jgi:hypothetical protein
MISFGMGVGVFERIRAFGAAIAKADELLDALNQMR